MALSREQRSILDEILSAGSAIRDPDKRRRYTRAAVQTGLVESNLRNLNYGDADSQGWRQERASLYANPTNVKASVRRFFNEAKALDKGQPSWQLAADVQRPAAQYRGRYREVAGQAKKLIGGQGGVRGGGGGRGGGRTPTRLAFNDQAVSGDTLAALQAMQRPQRVISNPAAPAHSAQPTLPMGYQGVETTAPQPRESRLTGALEQLMQSGVADANQIGGTKIGRGGGGGGAGARASLKPHGSYEGTTGIVNALARLAERKAGTTVTSGKRSTVNTASGGVSDHYEGNRSANARDIAGTVPQMDRAAKVIARALGISYKKGSPLVATVNRNGVRYQVLYRTNVGGNHFDHVHVGAKRL